MHDEGFSWRGAFDVGEPYLGLARDVMARGAQLGRMRPPHDVSSSTRGLPAVLQELAEADGTLTPGAIAERTHVTDARVANILRVMEERGWITRTKAADDRRRVEVALTQEGRTEYECRKEEVVRFCAGFLREMGEDDARQLLHVMGRMVEVLSAHSKKRGE